jgi:hypothetical protein
MSKTVRLCLRLAIASCAILALVSLAFATAQQGDILFLDGKKYSIYTNPLEPFLRNNPDRMPKSNIVSSALWRGYVATWRVKNERLVLVDVGILKDVSKPGEKGLSTEIVSVMDKVFPGEKDVVANWFSGHIIIPDGKLVNYVHMGYASTYEKYILLRVEQGVVTRTWTADAPSFVKFRDAQFAAFKKTEEYRKALAETAKEGGMDARQNEEFLREFYSERYMSMIFENPQ